MIPEIFIQEWQTLVQIERNIIMLKCFLFSVLFLGSLYILYCLDKKIYHRFKIFLILLFIFINAVLMVGLSFSDLPFFGMIYNGCIALLIVLPSIIGFFVTRKGKTEK